jgi:peroxiredoxin
MFNYKLYKKGYYSKFRKLRPVEIDSNNELISDSAISYIKKSNLKKSMRHKKKHKKSVRFSEAVENVAVKEVKVEPHKIDLENWDINFDVIELI